MAAELSRITCIFLHNMYRECDYFSKNASKGRRIKADGDGGEGIDYTNFFFEKPLVIRTTQHTGISGGINLAPSLI